MTIQYEGLNLERGLKAALFKCRTCGDSILYQGSRPGDSAKFVADLHDKTETKFGPEHNILVKAYRQGDPWPEKDLSPTTQFFTLWVNPLG